jgi:hypothetical protein
VANAEHVARLKQGVEAWNAWRGENRYIDPDLRRANLRRAKLSGADLRDADLSLADLREADLSGAYLMKANLSHVDLSKANLSRARLYAATLIGTVLRGADLSEAGLGGTFFAVIELEGAIGLESCHHAGWSSLDLLTLASEPLPLAFLRGVGLPDPLIDYLPSLLNQPIQFYSCFISYSAKSQEFAERLHADLQDNGVRCWFAPHDMPIGAKMIDALDEAIRVRDKVLLILSEDAIASDWVEGEVTTALAEERKRKQLILFPVCIDDSVFQTSEPWARLLRGERNLGDFTRWKEHDSYRKSFERVLKDLKVVS